MISPDLSIIIPVLNEDGNLEILFKEIIEKLEDNNINHYELLFVDDGSTDSSWEIISRFIETNDMVKGLKLSRNFGHDNAMKAGIDHCTGNFAICMDADMQHSPNLIPKIYHCFRENKPDIIFMQRIENKDTNFLQGFYRRMYYKLFKYLTKLDIREGVSDFFGISRKVIDVIKNLHEKVYFNRGVLFSIGFKREFIEYKADERYSGQSSYNARKLVSLLISSIINFTYVPLKIVVVIGLIISAMSFLYGMYAITKTIIFGSIDGWTSIVTTLSFLNGFIILVLTVIIEYFIVVFKEVKGRPNYIIESKR